MVPNEKTDMTMAAQAMVRAPMFQPLSFLITTALCSVLARIRARRSGMLGRLRVDCLVRFRGKSGGTRFASSEHSRAHDELEQVRLRGNHHHQYATVHSLGKEIFVGR
jgi:hypothetical protein